MANGTPNFFANLMNGGGSSAGTGGAGSHNGSVGSIGSHGNGGAIQVQDMEPPGNATYRYGDEADTESGDAPPQSQRRRQQHPLARAGSELDLPKG